MSHPRVLITAGPTHEPIDEVRYIANRSSGRIGIEIAEAALDAGWQANLALGPTCLEPRTVPRPGNQPVDHPDTHDRSQRFRLLRFRTTADLQELLSREAPDADVLIMAAAVADFRVRHGDGSGSGKIRRTEHGMTLNLESTPDLIAECVRDRARSGHGKPGLIVAFALEPAANLLETAQAKLARKGADLIVANPLETMDAATVDAHLLDSNGLLTSTNGPITKDRFGEWLIRSIGSYVQGERSL